MNVIKSLFIPCIETEYDANYIIDALYCNNIATVSKITLLPFVRNTGTFNRAYIDILEWHETEAAYNFVNRLRSGKYETRLCHSDDNWWAFQINKKPYITGDKKLEAYTVLNYLVLNCDEPWVQGTNKAGKQLLSYINDYQDWKEIERDLSEMLAYQNMEYELCL